MIRHPKTTVLFQDETYARMHPSLMAAWAPPGQRPVIDTWDSHQRRVLYGSVNPRTGALDLLWSNSLCGPAMVAHLEQIARSYPTGRVYVVMDNGGAHHSKLVENWFAQQRRLRPFYLPPYSPDLNPIERLWKDYRSQVLHNHRYRQVSELEAASRAYHDQLAANPERVRRLVAVSYGSLLS